MANLITLAEYKTFEGISSTQYDDKLSALVTSVSQLVKTYCGHSIIDYYTDFKEEVFSVSWGTEMIQVTETPLLYVSSVQERDKSGDSYIDLDDDEYFVDKNLDTLFRVQKGTGIYKNWETGAGSVVVRYRAGYETCPEDLKLAVFDLITYYHKNEHKPRQTLSGATRENASSGESKGFPDHIKRVLDLYKTY